MKTLRPQVLASVLAMITFVGCVSETEDPAPKTTPAGKAAAAKKPVAPVNADVDEDAKGDATADAKGDATADAKGDATADATADAKGDAAADVKADATADAKTDTGTKEPPLKQPELPVAAAKFTPKDYSDAKIQLKTYCVTCHGLKGKGDGPAAMALNPKPRDWTDPKWHASVTDEQIFKVIKEGGAKNGLSPLMAPNPQYQDRPGAIHALVKMIRKFKDK